MKERLVVKLSPETKRKLREYAQSIDATMTTAVKMFVLDGLANADRLRKIVETSKTRNIKKL